MAIDPTGQSVRRSSGGQPYHHVVSLLPSPLAPTGGVFRLDRNVTTDLSRSITGGWSAFARSDGRDLIVSGPLGSADYETALEDAISAAQEALDLIAVKGGPALTIEGAETGHIVWWTETRGIVLREMAISDLGFRFSATAEVRDPAGNLVTQPAPPPVPWHESFRYFRISQTTGDLFDAYRNLYLAVESLLSTVAPQHLNAAGVPAEGDNKWLRRALTQVHPATVDLANYAVAGAANPVDAVYDDLYAGTRTRLFHSKAGRPVLLPHTLSGRENVLASLERLGRLYVDLARAVLSLQRGSGVMTYAGFRAATNFAAEIVLSDDRAPAEKTDTVINPSGGAVVALPTQPPDQTRPGITTWASEALVTDVLARIPVIRRVAMTINGDLGRLDIHQPALNIDDAAVLQVHRSLQLVNPDTVKFRYVT
jgi:hypothetical protein